MVGGNDVKLHYHSPFNFSSSQHESFVPLLVQQMQAIGGLLPAFLSALQNDLNNSSAELAAQHCRTVLTLLRAGELNALLIRERDAIVAIRAALSVRETIIVQFFFFFFSNLISDFFKEFQCRTSDIAASRL